MAKRCIFCGEPPEKKNKEHVLPRWLLEMTGPVSREFYLGPDYTQEKISYRSFSASSFTFPSCKACNDEYSHLEARVKGTVQNLLKNNTLLSSSLTDFFDWFDKVRIGLWLAYQMLDKNPFEIEPNYYIKQRVATADRCLFVFRASSDTPGIRFAGIQSPLFQFSPVCFSMSINHYVFLNLSSDFIAARRLGFPYAATLYFTEKKGQLMIENIEAARERPMRPIFNHGVTGFNIGLSQAVYSKFLSNEAYASPYVRQTRSRMDFRISF